MNSPLSIRKDAAMVPTYIRLRDELVKAHFSNSEGKQKWIFDDSDQQCTRMASAASPISFARRSGPTGSFPRSVFWDTNSCSFEK